MPLDSDRLSAGNKQVNECANSEAGETADRVKNQGDGEVRAAEHAADHQV